MAKLLVGLGLLIVVTSCSAPPDGFTPMVPTGPAPAAPPPVAFETEFPDWLGPNRTSRTHELAAPVDGAFTLRLTWDPVMFDGTLKMMLGDRALADSPYNCSPIVGRVEARAGETYAVEVSAAGAEFSHVDIPSTAYLLTATFEEHRPGVLEAPTRSPAATAAGVIAEVRDTYFAGRSTYSVTAPADGTLVGRLTWNAARRNAARLGLSLGSVRFLPSPPAWSPVVGRIQVHAGQTCRVDVEESMAFWDYFDDPFVLTFSVE